MEKSRSPFFSVDFWFKVVGAVVLLALGVTGIFAPDLKLVMVSFVCVFMIVLFELIEVVPTIKVTTRAGAKVLTTFEIIVCLAIGVALGYATVLLALNKKDDSGNLVFFANLIKSHYIHIFAVGLVLYIRGIIYFACAVLYEQPTKKKTFWINVLFITFGVVCLSSRTNMNAVFAWIIIVLSLASGVYLGVSGGGSYYQYRKYVINKKQAEKEEIVEKAPGRGKAPMVDEEDEDDKIIEPDVDDDRPSVN